jgi:hypothetical protein
MWRPFLPQQSKFFSELKTTIKPCECVVLWDVGEIYSFILQEDAQGHHWNNAQATIQPFTMFFKTILLLK